MTEKHKSTEYRYICEFSRDDGQTWVWESASDDLGGQKHSSRYTTNGKPFLLGRVVDSETGEVLYQERGPDVPLIRVKGETESSVCWQWLEVVYVSEDLDLVACRDFSSGGQWATQEEIHPDDWNQVVEFEKTLERRQYTKQQRKALADAYAILIDLARENDELEEVQPEPIPTPKPQPEPTEQKRLMQLLGIDESE